MKSFGLLVLSLGLSMTAHAGEFSEMFDNQENREFARCTEQTSGGQLELKSGTAHHVGVLLGRYTIGETTREFFMPTVDGQEFGVDEIVDDTDISGKGATLEGRELTITMSESDVLKFKCEFKQSQN